MKALWPLVILLVGCGVTPQKVSISDPEVRSLFEVARQFSREKYGFTPLPSAPDSDIRLERHSEGVYNVMLHIYGVTSRTIAFRRTPTGIQWIHEQETFPGPNMYRDMDGLVREQITLTYGAANVSGHSLNTLNINYDGEDPRLRGIRELSLDQVKPVLEEWGYGR